MKNIAGLATFMCLCSLLAIPARGIESTPKRREPGWLYEIRVGVLAYYVDGLWSGLRKEGGVDCNAEIIYRHPSFQLLLGAVRPNSGLSINNREDTSKVYGSLLWEIEMKQGIFQNLGVGAAVHDGELETSEEDKKQLGSRVLIRIPIEFGYELNRGHRVLIGFDHVSKVSLATPNEGLDPFGLRYGYRFQP